MKDIAIGTDIGGTHISCRLFNLQSKTFLSKTPVRKAIDCHAQATEILTVWTEAIAEAAGDIPFTSLAGIGIAMPGPFDYENGVGWFKGVGKFDNLYGADVRSEILNRLALPQNYRLRFMNDASCFAIGESLMGEVSVHSRILAVTLGTGFGTTFIENNKAVSGKFGIPADGFLYHIPVGSTIADDHFSSRWFLNEYQSIAGKTIQGVKELAELADNDAIAASIFSRFGELLGDFLSPWLNSFEAGGLVIGGSISSAFPLFGPNLIKILKRNSVVAKVYLSVHQEESALSGSAYLCI